MAENSAFFSIWAQDSSYWIAVEGPAAKAVTGVLPISHNPDICAKKVDRDWAKHWVQIAETMQNHSPAGVGHRAAVIPSELLPELDEIRLSLHSFPEISAIANNLWLIEYVNHGRLGCYMQRVIDRRGKQVGYESFARMEAPDGGIIGGGAIMQAALALRVEYQLDRVLHRQAIQSFVDCNLDGYIFINFLTGFIHRPEVYLDGLSQAATKYQMRPASVVLDVPVATDSSNLSKLKTISEYCRTRGFALALDDVTSVEGLSPLLAEVRPAIVKLDRNFGKDMNDARRMGILREIVRLAHANGASVLAEGVESNEIYENYLGADVDMFQGYLFGAPERFPQEANKKAKKKG